MCDVESYIYMPLLEEIDYMPKHKYAYDPELRAYANKLAEKWQLNDRTVFQLETQDATWGEEVNEWAVNILSKRTKSHFTK